MQLFFMNGGGACYILSVGTYLEEGKKGADPADFQEISSLLNKEVDPTLIIVPDALLFDTKEAYYTLMNQCLDHCGMVQNRMTLMDVYGGEKQQSNDPDPVSALRNKITSSALRYGAAYYPWLNTAIIQEDEVDCIRFISAFKKPYFETDPMILDKINKILGDLPSLPLTNDPNQIADYQITLKTAHTSLCCISPNYQSMVDAICHKMNILPTVPAVAGCIAQIDAAEGVWKAPANISLSAVVSPLINITSDMQEGLNVDVVSGKSINAIRSFVGIGSMIWGARTLDGNSQDWRYINVRRTMIMLEQSIKLAVRSYVFAPNDANTWLSVKSMVENFLTGIWQQGGLAGAKPEEAFNVSVGLGSNMTAEDILNGYMNISVVVALTHPAEFIEISFAQQMQ